MSRHTAHASGEQTTANASRRETASTKPPAITHPLLSGRTILPTPPISELFLAIKRIVLLRELGCCFTARSGFGKSSALAMVDVMLRVEFDQLAVYRHIILNQQVPSIRAFFKHFLKTVNHAERRGETADLRQRVVNRLVEAGKDSGLDLVVLLIDEAQEMALQDFKFLKDIDNELDKEGVKLVVIMMGQEPEFGDVVSRLRESGRIDLVSRFTMRQREYRGLSSVDDFTALLRQIDSATIARGESMRWVEYFLPNAWESGLRLASQATPLLQALTNAAGTACSHKGFPARQLFLAIRYLLLELAGKDAPTLQIDTRDWADAAEYALIKDASIVAAAAQKKREQRMPKIRR